MSPLPVTLTGEGRVLILAQRQQGQPQGGTKAHSVFVRRLCLFGSLRPPNARWAQPERLYSNVSRTS